MFFFCFLFSLILRKFDTPNVRFYLPTEKKKFYRNLRHPIQRRLSFLISKSVWHNFAEKYACKNQCFSGYDDTLMTYINFPVHGHIREFIEETVFCNYYQFYIDAIMVSKKFKEEVIKNNFQ